MLCKVQITSSPVRSFESLGREWRALEDAATTLSIFQSWSWVGCCAAERYPDPVLLRAEADGRTLGLALFNRRDGRLCLAESGNAALDAPFIEHNAPLIAADAPATTETALMRAAWGLGGTRRLVLSGVSPALSDAAGGTPWRRQERIAPMVDLAAVRAGGGDWLATRSANTRQALRRSARAYAARGALCLDAARDVAEALDWFAALVLLHTRSWQARGQPGAFATPFLRRFHHALIAETAARGELSLLRATAGAEAIGYLYNFRLRGRVFAYQSGLDLAGAGAQSKPGLTCHALAIERALAAGDAVYDFLGGADRYKRSLANAGLPLVWAELVPRWSARGMAARLRHRLG